MNISIHRVVRIELSRTFLDNDNQRTVRIVYTKYDGTEFSSEITVFGETESLDALPKADDFKIS